MKKNRSRKSSSGKLPLRTVPEDGLLPVEDVEGGEGHEEHQPEPHHQVHLHHVYPVEEGFRQKRRQRSSLLLGVRN